MAAAFDPYKVPHRKPLHPEPAHPQARAPDDGARAHQHSRTVSSNIFPQHMSSAPLQNAGSHNRRTSGNTFVSTTSQAAPSRSSSNASAPIRRSTSSRSGQSFVPTSYVALLRKQKATVWCDRAQHEDPRLIAQQKAEKARATREVVGGQRTSTGLSMGSAGVRSKIRHHGAPRATGYAPANLFVASGVPMRLSASEVGDEEGSDGDNDSQNQHQRRTGSGRSSLASHQQVARQAVRLSQGSTPPGNQSSPDSASPNILDETAETPVPGNLGKKDYFQPRPPAASRNSTGSGERENSFGNIGDMAAPRAQNTRKDDAKTVEELSRRGSVDERAMTMRTGRLFIANPDVDGD